MGANTRITLPHSAQSQKVLEVIAKVVGIPFEVENLYKEEKPLGKYGMPRKPKPIDASLPSSADNTWRLVFEGWVHELKVTPNSGGYDALSHGNLMFKDAAGQQYAWMLHTETEEENTRSMLPSSHPLGVAVGIRLVKFFGGTVCYNDGVDEEKPSNRLRKSPARAKFPPKTKDQTSNDRWHQFQNALRAEPMLTVKELEHAAKFAAYPSTDKYVVLLERLKVEESRRLLDEASAPATGIPRSGPRL
jgi:hypothetical protein